MSRENMREHLAFQLEAAIRLFAVHVDMDDSELMQIPDFFPAFESKPIHGWQVGFIFRWGVDTFGDTQLWRIIQQVPNAGHDHRKPDELPGFFVRIGFNEETGHPVWTQPLGGHDAYMRDDIVYHLGQLWISHTDNNIWEPGIHGWTPYPIPM